MIEVKGGRGGGKVETKVRQSEGAWKGEDQYEGYRDRWEKDED